MEKRDILELIGGILGCSLDEIEMQSGLSKHYLWDSLAHIEIIIGIENHFKVEIPENKIEELVTVEKIVEYLLNIKKII